MVINLTSEVCGNRLPWNEIQGQSKRQSSREGGAASGHPTMLNMVSLALALDFITRQPITTGYWCQTTNGHPRLDSRQKWRPSKTKYSNVKALQEAFKVLKFSYRGPLRCLQGAKIQIQTRPVTPWWLIDWLIDWKVMVFEKSLECLSEDFKRPSKVKAL